MTSSRVPENRKIAYLQIAFYVDSPSEYTDKADQIMDSAGEVMCPPGCAEGSGPCNLVLMTGELMTEEKYDQMMDL